MKKQIQYNNEMWNVLAFGKNNANGETYVHMQHPTRGQMQKNGFVGEQRADFIMIPNSYYMSPADTHEAMSTMGSF